MDIADAVKPGVVIDKKNRLEADQRLGELHYRETAPD
jgi:hypothetical protein